MSTLAVTFLRTHPDFPYFPGQTVELEITAAGPLIAAGFAAPAEPATALPIVTDTYAGTPTTGYWQAIEPAAKPTELPAEFSTEPNAE